MEKFIYSSRERKWPKYINAWLETQQNIMSSLKHYVIIKTFQMNNWRLFGPIKID